MTFVYPEGTILGAVVGSQAQGFATPTSDTDYGCVYLLPIIEHVPIGENAPKLSIQLHEPADCWGHELRKFVALAQSCNPTILELLWVQPDVITLEGTLLRSLRSAFITPKRLADAYSGFAFSQFGRAKEERKEKARRHALRLLTQATIALRDGRFMVELPQVVRDDIVDIAETATDDQFLALFSDKQGEVRELGETSPHWQCNQDLVHEAIVSTYRLIRQEQIKDEFCR